MARRSKTNPVVGDEEVLDYPEVEMLPVIEPVEIDYEAAAAEAVPAVEEKRNELARVFVSPQRKNLPFVTVIVEPVPGEFVGKLLRSDEFGRLVTGFRDVPQDVLDKAPTAYGFPELEGVQEVPGLLRRAFLVANIIDVETALEDEGRIHKIFERAAVEAANRLIQTLKEKVTNE